MLKKQTKVKTRKPTEATRRIAEVGREKAERGRISAEKVRARAEKGRRAVATQNRELEARRRTAEEMRRTVDTIRESAMQGIQLQERKREQAEQIRTDRIEELIGEAHQGIKILHREATSQLEEMKNILKSAKEIFHAMQEMLQKASQ